jgi:beta-glucosidase/6-phospho-beta-glucosidase/beta-galactosidase
MATCFSPLSTAPPKTLEWGAATSAYQIEGAIKAGDRGEDIWTPWVHKPFHILDGSNGESHKSEKDFFLDLSNACAPNGCTKSAAVAKK